jgi:hypothetical protein
MRGKIGAAALAAVVLICLPGARATAAGAEPTLEQVRAATEKYRDVKVALAEGFIADPGNMCETADMMGRPASDGAMGIHYFRPDLLGIKGPPDPRVSGDGTHTDWLNPGILIYEPQADGSLQLVAVENLVFAKAWHAAGNKQPPNFQGQPYDHMVDDPKTQVDEAHMFEEHYDRHVWLYRENPKGMFAQFNPNVSCKHSKAPAGHAGH